MTHYLASVQNKKTREIMVIGMNCEKKSDLYDALCSMYDVRFITTKEKYTEDCEKWYREHGLFFGCPEKMTDQELREILENHKKWVRRESDGERADLCGAHLCRAYLCGAYLCRAKLNGVKLRGADLREADLREADLREADLHGANLHGANLCGADLRGADLREADLREADLHGANLR